MTAGDAVTAIRIYRQLAREYPLSLRPRIKLGEALLAAGATQEAARAYQGANSVNPTYEGHTGLGRVYLAMRQPAGALEEFDAALKMKAGDTSALNGRAVALDQAGRHEEAQKLYIALLDKEPTNLRVRNNYALSLALAGKYDDATDILSSLAQAPDSEARVRQNLAFVYGLQGNDGQAGHFGRMDLDEDAVNSNLQYYQRIRNMKGAAAKTAPLANFSASNVAHEARAQASAETATPRYAEAAPAEVAAAPKAVTTSAADKTSAKTVEIKPAQTREIASTTYRAPSDEQLALAAAKPVTVTPAKTSTGLTDDFFANSEPAPVAAAPHKVEEAQPSRPAPKQETEAKKPAKSAKSHRASLMSLPMTKAEAAAQETGTATESISAPAEVANVAPAKPASAKNKKRNEKEVAQANASGNKRAPAVPPIEPGSRLASDVTLVSKGGEVSTKEAPPISEADTSEVEPATGDKHAVATPKERPQREAKASTKTQGTGVSGALANPLDTGVRRPAVPAVL